MAVSLTIDELRTSVNSVGISLDISKKEAETLVRIIGDDERPMLLFLGLDERDNNTKKIILTDRNIFFLTSKAFRAVNCEVTPLHSVLDVQEKRGVLFAEVAVILENSTIHINMMDKRASSKLVSFMKKIKEQVSSDISLDKTSKLEALFALKEKGAITEDEYEREKGKILNSQSDTNSVTSQLAIPERKKSGCAIKLLKFLIGIIVLFLIAGFFISSEAIEKTKKVADNFTPKYTVVEEDNLTLAGVPRFEQRISVPLGLSHEELKKNLLDAAWKLQKKKNAAAVIIFAFREDDKERKGGYSAGKCTLAPFGNWAKAIENHDVSDISEEIIISEAYDYSEPLRTKNSLAYVKDNGTELYRIDKKADIYETLASLKKGTEVKILDCERQFSFSAVIDLYKVQTRISRKKTLTGWIYGYQLTDRK